MNNIFINRASIKDIDKLMEWRMRVLYAVYNITPTKNIEAVRNANRKYYIENLPTNAHIACFSMLDDKTIGCGGVCIQNELPSPDNTTGICAYIMNIYTLPEFRNLGSAGKTVNWLINKSLEIGAQKIYLETTSMGKPLYSQIGFEPMVGFLKYKT